MNDETVHQLCKQAVAQVFLLDLSPVQSEELENVDYWWSRL
jgi:hypothetical protein